MSCSVYDKQSCKKQKHACLLMCMPPFDSKTNIWPSWNPGYKMSRICIHYNLDTYSKIPECYFCQKKHVSKHVSCEVIHLHVYVATKYTIYMYISKHLYIITFVNFAKTSLIFHLFKSITISVSCFIRYSFTCSIW